MEVLIKGCDRQALRPLALSPRQPEEDSRDTLGPLMITNMMVPGVLIWLWFQISQIYLKVTFSVLDASKIGVGILSRSS